MSLDSIRVLHVVSGASAGGAETYVKQLAIELRRLGHRPAIGLISLAAEAGRNVEFERQYLAELDDAGVDHFFIGHASRRVPLLGMSAIRKYCRGNDIDLYHSHLKWGVIFGAFLRIPRVTTHHNSVAQVPLWVYRVLNLMVDQYVGISEVCGHLLRRYTGRQVRVIRNGIDLSKFAPSIRDPGPKAKFKFLSIGRIFPQKNYQLLVRAIALLPPHVRDRMQLAIAGEGAPDVMRDLQHQITAAKLGDCITLLGNRDDIPILLQRSDLLVMSSAWEGYPIALLEATASGLPFVATDVGGCREIAQLCGNGRLVAADDAQGLADAIADLIGDPAKMHALSAAAVASASKLSIKAAAGAHLELYRAMLRKRSRTAPLLAGVD